jgi:[acyl-carrier-protein] S-malonyltransferase
MGKELYDNSQIAKELFHQANEIFRFTSITDIMFAGSADELKQTKSNATSRIFYIRLF